MAKAKSEPLIERIRSVHPKYAALLERQAGLLERQAAAQAEANPLNQEERKVLLGWIAQSPKPKPKPIVRHQGAVALVGELLSPQPIEEISPPPPRPLWPGEQRQRELGAELESIAEALKLLEPELTKARQEYSKLIAERRLGDYSALVETAVDRARDLGNIILSLHEFANQARLDGVELKYLKPLNVSAFGDLEEGSPLFELVANAVQLRHVGLGKIPAWKIPAPLALLS